MSYADAISMDVFMGVSQDGETAGYRSTSSQSPLLASKGRYRSQYSTSFLITENFPQSSTGTVGGGSGAEKASGKVFELKRQASKRKLISLLGSFHEHGYSAMSPRKVKISKQSLEASAAFLQLLPEKTPMPHVLPDGEDGVILAWDAEGTKTYVTIENWVVHCVQDALGADRKYIDSVDFRPNKIPDLVLNALTGYSGRS